MKRWFLVGYLLFSACLVVPAPILAEPDAGGASDAGIQSWTLLPQEDALLGNRDDANAEEAGFQVLLQIQGPLNSSFGIYDGDDLLVAGQTDDEGAASLEITLVHGVQQPELRAGVNRVTRTLNIDLIGPTFTLTTPSEAARMPEISWSNLEDRDGVGANDGVHLEFAVDQGSTEALRGLAGTRQIAGLSAGDHQLVVRATDETGNQTELSRTLTMGFARFTTAHRLRYVLDGRPCAGDVNNDGFADLAIIRNPASGLALLPWILLGGAELDPEVKKTLSLSGQRNSECLFAEIVSGGGDELVVSTTGDGDRLLSRFEFLHWVGDPLDGTLLHLLTETGAPAGLARGNMAVFPLGLAQEAPSEGARNALVLQTGSRHLRIFDVARFSQASPSGIGAIALNVQMDLSGSVNGRTVTTGAFRQPGKQGIAIGRPQGGDSDEGVIWLIDEALPPNQSYQLNDEVGENQFRPAHFSRDEGAKAANLLTTMRFNDDAIDDVLAAADSDQQSEDRLFVYVLGQEPTILPVPEAAGDVRDLDACDLNGDGLDEISVAGRDAHRIRWGDGQWTASEVADGTNYTLCAGDMTGDGLEDLVVVTRDINNTIHILH